MTTSRYLVTCPFGYRIPSEPDPTIINRAIRGQQRYSTSVRTLDRETLLGFLWLEVRNQLFRLGRRITEDFLGLVPYRLLRRLPNLGVHEDGESRDNINIGVRIEGRRTWKEGGETNCTKS